MNEETASRLDQASNNFRTGRRTTSNRMTDIRTMMQESDAFAAADRRRHVRVAGPFDGRRIGVLPIQLRIYDLSQGGCFVNSVHEQRSGVAIMLEIDLPGEGWIRVKGETLYAKPEFGFAVRFVEMSDELSTRLQRALQQIADGVD